ncbi:hypothetical protein [Achromobacter sp. EB05]|uniref:hypothetical protein n=1 Tax=Achromobacter sp. EB05 TaxID=3142974 RepID=UPI0037840C15
MRGVYKTFSYHVFHQQDQSGQHFAMGEVVFGPIEYPLVTGRTLGLTKRAASDIGSAVQLFPVVETDVKLTIDRMLNGIVFTYTISRDSVGDFVGLLEVMFPSGHVANFGLEIPRPQQQDAINDCGRYEQQVRRVWGI